MRSCAKRGRTYLPPLWEHSWNTGRGFVRRQPRGVGRWGTGAWGCQAQRTTRKGTGTVSHIVCVRAGIYTEALPHVARFSSGSRELGCSYVSKCECPGLGPPRR